MKIKLFDFIEAENIESCSECGEDMDDVICVKCGEGVFGDFLCKGRGEHLCDECHLELVNKENKGAKGA